MLEGLPLVALEAKRAALPTVAFPIGPFPEVIDHGRTGWLCRTIDAASLAEGLKYFLCDLHRQEEAGSAARASLRQFQHERFADQWWTLFAGDGKSEPRSRSRDA